jgi:hypothetical protein
MNFFSWLHYCILTPLWNALRYWRKGDKVAARACVNYVKGEIWKEL